MSTISIALQSQSLNLPEQHREHPSTQCQLQWRQGQLLVQPCHNFQQSHLSSLSSKQRLVECLKKSPVRLVRLDPMMGEAALKHWAEACEQAKKPAFLLQGTIAKKLPRKPNSLAGIILQVLDRIAALVLLIGLSPMILALMAFIYAHSPQTIFTFSWHIGLRGKLFKALKFHTTLSHPNSRPTPLERWMRKYRLDKVPQLLNVVRGEMSLIGVRPLTLSEVVQPGLKDQEQMNVLLWGQASSEFVAEA